MRAFIPALLCCLALLADGQRPAPPAPKALPQGASLDIVVQELKGDVDVQTDPKAQWQSATRGMKLPVGARLCTGVSSEAAISFGGNSAALVGETTVFKILSYDMQGDQLVAKVFIDPGLTHVTVKQLPQFHTDFQVSTPRLTCSVKGSGMTVDDSGDELGTRTLTTDDQQFVETKGGQHLTVANGGTTMIGGENTTIQLPNDVAAKDSLPPPTEGQTAAETKDSLLLDTATTSVSNSISDTNLNVTPTPSSGSTSNVVLPPPPVPPCDPVQMAADQALLQAHGLGAIVFFLQTGDPNHKAEAQEEWYGVNLHLGPGDPDQALYQQKHDAIHRLVGCSEFGGQLQDFHGITTPSEGGLLDLARKAEDISWHIFDDGLPTGNPTFAGGLESPTDESLSVVAKLNGFTTFVNTAFLPHIQDLFNADPAGLQRSNPALFNAIKNDFLTDAAGFGLNQYASFLQQADIESKPEPNLVGTLDAGMILLSGIHSGFERGELYTPPMDLATYQQEHRDTISDLTELQSLLNGNSVNDPQPVVGVPNTGYVIPGDVDHFLATFGAKVFDGWEEQTGFKSGNHDKFDVNDPYYYPRQHFHDDMIATLQAFRDATGTNGIAFGSQEDAAARSWIDMDDLRRHVNNLNDPTEYQAVHGEAQFEIQAVELIGLKASFDVFRTVDDIKSIQNQLTNNSLFFLVNDPNHTLFNARNSDFHDINNFGFDALLRDMRNAADAARAGTLTGGLFGNVIIENTRTDRFRDFFGEPPGNSLPGQFGYDRQQLQMLVNSLSGTLAGGSGYTAFLTQFENKLDQAWHAAHPNNTGPSDPAHLHFHATLTDFDTQARSAIAPR